MPYNGRDTNWPHKSKFQDSKLHNNSVEKHAYQSIKHSEFFMELIVRVFLSFLHLFRQHTLLLSKTKVCVLFARRCQCFAPLHFQISQHAIISFHSMNLS